MLTPKKVPLCRHPYTSVCESIRIALIDGHAVGIVIDPKKEGSERVNVFPSIQAGNQYLQYLRSLC